MPRAKTFLGGLCQLGKPLIEFTIVPSSGEDLAQVVEILNTLGPDLEAKESYWNRISPTHNPGLIGADATSEALNRLFGWRVERIQTPWLGFSWVERNQPSRFPPSLDGRIQSMGITSPGADDEGQADLLQYDADEPLESSFVDESVTRYPHNLWTVRDRRPHLVETYPSWADAVHAMRDRNTSLGAEQFWVQPVTPNAV